MESKNENYLNFKNLLYMEDKYGVGFVEYYGWVFVKKNFVEELRKACVEKYGLVSLEELSRWHKPESFEQWVFNNYKEQAIDFIQNLVAEKANKGFPYKINIEQGHIQIFNNNKFVCEVEEPNRGVVKTYPGLKLYSAQIANELKNKELMDKEYYENPELEKMMRALICLHKDIQIKLSQQENISCKAEQTIYENNLIEVKLTGNEVGHIAIIENKTNEELYLDFNGKEDTLILEADSWKGIVGDEKGWELVEQIKNNSFDIDAQNYLNSKKENIEIPPEKTRANNTGSPLNNFEEIRKRWLEEKYKYIKRDAVKEAGTIKPKTKNERMAKVI